MARQLHFFEQSRMTLEEAVAESLASLNEYATRFRNWVFTFSGGKDSTATASLALWAVRAGLVPAPERFVVLNADTGMEIVPLWLGARKFLAEAERDGAEVITVRPALDDRVFVAILGRGLPPFNSNRRYCTRMLKVDPMDKAVAELSARLGTDDILFLTGLRLGESRSRDQRIAVACSSDSGECGQGFFQERFNSLGLPSLSPVVHWRVCNVFDWLYFDDRHGYSVDGVVEVYGDEDIRTGCMACFAVERDKALERVARNPKWAHLGVLLELYDVYDWLGRWENRLRMPLSFNRDGGYCLKTGTVGPLTMGARREGLRRVLDIQDRAGVEIVSDEELARIRWHWDHNTWPRGWTGEEPLATKSLSARYVTLGDRLAVQPVLRNMAK